MSSMEAELLTVLGRIPAPDDRDLPTQLANIERSGVEVTIVDPVWIYHLSCVRSKNNELKSYQDQYEKGRIAVSRLQAQLEETEWDIWLHVHCAWDVFQLLIFVFVL